jgi:hypothetical protein
MEDNTVDAGRSLRGHDPKPILHGLNEGLLSGVESEGLADS